VRLSIHSSNNSGPKFSICLFDPAKVKAVDRIGEDMTMSNWSETRHIPTPWHNCVVELDGPEALLITKSQSVRDCLKSGVLVGEWIASIDGYGGYFKATWASRQPEDRVNDQGTTSHQQRPRELQ